MSDQFVRRFARLIRRRIEALDAIADFRRVDAGAAYNVASEALLAFAIEDRLKIVVLLGRCDGTRHEGFANRLVRDLQRQALAYARTIRPGLEVTPALRFSLDRIFRNWMRTLVDILEQFDTETEIREVMARFSCYHLAGLKRLFS